MTDDEGYYSFDELGPGTYQLSERQPAVLFDGIDTTPVPEAVSSNDLFTNVVLGDDQTLQENNFGEGFLRPEYISLRWFLASTPPPQQMLRRTVANGEERAGNPRLAESIRAGGGDIPDDEGHQSPVEDPGNQLFGAVTTGPFDAPDLLGIRTDLQAGAPPISRDHVSTPVSYADFSNPPTYGPHHAFLSDAQNNSITPRPTGVYRTQQPDEDLVHNLEHGHVWISYNPSRISSSDLGALEQLVQDGGTNTGVILTPRSENNTAIALASWAHLLTLNAFDGVKIRDFVETNRGHAPEGFIPSGEKGPLSESLDDGLLHAQSLNQQFGRVTLPP